MAANVSLETFGYLFYIASPNKTSFATPEEVPDYTEQVVPCFILLIFLEQCLAHYKKKATMRVNDCIGSVTQGMLQQLSKIGAKSLEFMGYCYIYNNWRLTALPWDSPWTWWTCFIAVDFFYYWFHRASHEINILWAAHQVHHSSEDYNLTTALRQSILQYYASWVFNLPMALAIPPAVFLVHNQFNLLYQFWIHTELIDRMGPLEYILNTASHHRVHHGRNRYCIDKNYGGTLIIWDRLFGTFEPEGEPIAYGLTHPINTFQPFIVQFSHYMHIWRTFWEVEGIKNKLSVIFKGPGWAPGKPWHGLIEDIPDVRAPMEKYDPKQPTWLKAYTFFHFLILLLGHVEITERFYNFPVALIIIAMSYQIFSLTTTGAMLDGWSFAPLLEFLRCVLFIIMDVYIIPVTRLGQSESLFAGFLLQFFRVVFFLSALLWGWFSMKTISIRLYSKKIS